MKTARITLLAMLVGFALVSPAAADDDPGQDAFAAWRLDAGLTFGHFEQQAKAEIGGARGERLVRDSFLGVNLFFTFNPIEYLGLGLYTQLDVGSREMGRFEGVDEDGRTVTSGELGGMYTELWVGPLIRGQWRWLFAEIGYGFGVRWDDGRTDLPAADGDTDEPLFTSPAVAWLVAIGAGVPIVESLQAVLRIEYRVRYYDRRASGNLADDLVHGTQNLTPFVGVAYEF